VKRTRTTNSQSQPATYDFRLFLQERFRAAARRNARFSLRAFARQLGVNHSTLSQILRGKRKLTPSSIHSLGQRMGLPNDAIQTYAGALKSLSEFDQTNNQTRSVQFDLDTFHLVTVWYHQAILELTHTRSFRTDSRWIAKTLGLTVDEVNVAVQRLLRLGLLEMSKRERWLDKTGDAEFQSPSLPESTSKFVETEMHALAVDAISSVESTRRVHSHMIMAIDVNKMPQLQRLIDQFMNDVHALLAKNTQADDVYLAEVSVLPITKLERGED
jgi:uncharacterized protein (TIGR02147 family)